MMRKALEIFIDSVIEHNVLQNVVASKCILKDKIKKLKNEKVLPNMEQVIVRLANGNRKKMDYYDFLRYLGNACSHGSDMQNAVSIDYENIILAMKGFHHLLLAAYRENLFGKPGNFREDLMPIENYRVYEAYVPRDMVRSRCLREFRAYLPDRSGRPAFYAIIRLYNKAELNENFMFRNADIFVETMKWSVSGIPAGIPMMHELTPYDNTHSSFYILAYLFKREPQLLSEKRLKKMCFAEKIRLCREIADCFLKLQQSPVAIYHRMFSYESIYMCDCDGKWFSYVAKFDFAKISMNEAAQTVRSDAVAARNHVLEPKLKKYIAPEWENATADTNIDWAKMDIYSMGVLFMDILSGKIGGSLPDFDQLEADLSDICLNIIERMIAVNPDERCSMGEIQAVFEAEEKKCK